MCTKCHSKTFHSYVCGLMDLQCGFCNAKRLNLKSLYATGLHSLHVVTRVKQYYHS